MRHLLRERKAECEEPVHGRLARSRLWRCRSREAGQQLEAVSVACISCCSLSSMGCFSLWNDNISIRMS